MISETAHRVSWVSFALVVTAAVAWLVPLPPPLVERWYSLGFYPILQHVLTSLVNTTRFAWSDFLAMSALAWCALTVRTAIRRSHVTGVGRSFGAAGLTLLAGASIALLWFLVTWGFNYQRVPLRDKVETSEQPVSTESVRRIASAAIDSLNGLHDEAHRRGWPDWDALPSALGSAFDHTQRRLGAAWPAVPGRLKWSMAGFFFERAGIAGMTSPWLLEVIPSRGVLPVERPFLVAHEWAHLAGYGDEAEANFVGWLVCMDADAGARYSGWLATTGHLLAALPASSRRQLAGRIGRGPLDDWRAIALRQRRQTIPAIRDAAWKTYDRYLQAQGIEAGVSSYQGVTRLIAGTRYAREWVPTMRHR